MTKLVSAQRTLLIQGIIITDDEKEENIFNIRYSCLVNIYGKVINIQALYTNGEFDNALRVFGKNKTIKYEECAYAYKSEVHKHIRKYIMTNHNNLMYCPNYVTIVHNSFGVTRNKMLVKDIQVREFLYHCKDSKRNLVPLADQTLNSNPPTPRQLLAA